MDTRFLESFLLVVDHGSIAEAARRLHLTSAAVSQRLHALESELGVRLVSRSGHTVKTTESGAAMLVHARKLLQDTRDLSSIANNGISGELRVGAISTSLSGLFPGILKLLSRTNPQLELYLLPGTSPELYRKVLDGELDAAVIAQPPFAIPKTCEWHVLRNEPLILLAPPSMPGRDPHALLTSEPFIRYDRNNWGGRLVDRYLRHVGIQPKDRFELDGLEAIALFVNEGLGVAIVPDWARPWPEGMSIRKLRLPGGSFARRIGLIWMRSSIRARLIQSFLKQAETAVTQMGRAHKKRRPGLVS